MDHDTARHLAWTALEQSVMGHTMAASDALDRIGEEGTPEQMFAVVQSWCGAAKAALENIGRGKPEGSFAAIEEIVPGSLERDPAEAFAARTMTAYLNGDLETGLALFKAAYGSSADEYTKSVFHALLLTADIVRDCVRVSGGGR